MRFKAISAFILWNESADDYDGKWPGCCVVLISIAATDLHSQISMASGAN